MGNTGHTHHVNYAYQPERRQLKKPAKQEGGTCYAHAVASVIRATESRIIGRNPPSHWSLANEIISKYGSEGYNSSVPLREQCAKRGLKYDQVSADEAKTAVSKDRAVLALFWLDDAQWSRFSAFYQRYPGGILTQKEIGARRDKTTGHAVCIIGYGQTKQGSYWKIKNSWGDQFADAGYFRLEMDALPSMVYYDVYFRVCDLTKQDLRNFDKFHK